MFFKGFDAIFKKTKVWNAFRNGLTINYFEMVDTFQFEINFAISKSTWNFNINKRFLRERGVQPQNGIPGFSLHFPKDLNYGYLRFEENGKIPLGR